MRIVYMGTPDFAVPCLEKIITQGHDVVGVVTQPDRPKGRGKKLHSPPVKITAEKYNIPVYQPEKVKTPGFLSLLQGIDPQVIVVVAYGKILPADILNLPPLGCVNVHASLLPKYRGAAPIHWAIINGEKETGITTMYMDQGMDTGDMILSAATAIGTEETVGELHDRLAVMGAELLTETLALIAQGKAPRVPQNHDEATYAPMLKREDELIHWHKPAWSIKNQILGMNPWPGTYTTWQGKVLKIWRVKITTDRTKEQPGTVVACDNQQLKVQAGDYCLLLTELQLQGCKKLKCKEFLCGNKLKPGTRLGE